MHALLGENARHHGTPFRGDIHGLVREASKAMKAMTRAEESADEGALAILASDLPSFFHSMRP